MITLEQMQQIATIMNAVGIKIEFYSNVETRETWFGFKSKKYFWVWLRAYNFTTPEVNTTFFFDHSYNQNIGISTRGIRRGMKFENQLLKLLSV